MKKIFLVDGDSQADQKLIGGKGAGLVRLADSGIRIPKTACITVEVYNQFVNSGGLRQKIGLELQRKPQAEMRWEEIWDMALRIKTLFLATPLPEDLESQLITSLHEIFGNSPVAVRSSADDEDQRSASFAGLHESYIGVEPSQVVEHVKRVWASLWSDRALLYREEIGLSITNSGMAVVVQEMIAGRASGVSFTQDPMGGDNMVVEAVYGLNQALVDGQIEPDRWILDKGADNVISWVEPEHRKKRAIALSGRLILEELPEDTRSHPPIDDRELFDLKKVCLGLSEKFGCPLDIEWTIDDKGLLYILQARPITTLAPTGDDDRLWYLSLHRSFDNLVDLQKEIESEILPAMENEALEMSAVDLCQLDDIALADTIVYRVERSNYFTDIYWKKCIPFAHGIRLFGDIYNELLKPQDPYEFVQLLSHQQMLSTSRNSQLHELAALLNRDEILKEQLESSPERVPDHPEFQEKFERLFDQFGFVFPGSERELENRQKVVLGVILEYSVLETPGQASAEEQRVREANFLQITKDVAYPIAGESLLALARASYRIRDDDNIYLGKVELQANLAVTEAKKRLEQQGISDLERTTPEEVAAILKGEQKPNTPTAQAKVPVEKKSVSRVRARQIVGQPAAKGVARGVARVINTPGDLMSFKAGEVLVVDSIDPNMTFVVPLAAAIVERRGGMLIHGAIIAREYGIPCITGVSDATTRIHPGDELTVDGYLGLLTIEKRAAKRKAVNH